MWSNPIMVKIKKKIKISIKKILKLKLHSVI